MDIREQNPVQENEPPHEELESVSVVIATRNRPAEMKECLDSLFVQTRLPAEILVVDASDNHETSVVISDFSSRGLIACIYL